MSAHLALYGQRMIESPTLNHDDFIYEWHTNEGMPLLVYVKHTSALFFTALRTVNSSS